MPASEFIGWQAYFDIYPFTQAREDERHAEMLSVLTYMSGRTLKNPTPESVFMPDYLQQRTAAKVIKDPLQRDDYAAFAAKLKAAQGQTK